MNVPGSTHRLHALLAGVFLALAVTPFFTLPARACSCMEPPDIRAWVDDSEAAFVGTMVEKRDAGVGEFGGESIYVFTVERWVKGDAGEVIEVRSASDGAACGFEFWTPDNRIGAVLTVENGELHGSLCSQVDPDVLIAAADGTRPSATGIAHLIAAQGWSSPRLNLLDAEGGLIVELAPGEVVGESSGTQFLEMCPGGERFVQVTTLALHVWSLEEMAPVQTHDLSSLEGSSWVSDVSCRDRDASSVWIVAGDDFTSRLIEVVPETSPIMELPGASGHIGTDFVVSQIGPEADAIRVDVGTGEQIRLNETPPGENWAISVAPHPTDGRVALVETRFSGGEAPVEATLRIHDPAGGVVASFEIPWETYAPTWLDGERVMVQTYDFEDWNRKSGLVFDLSTGQSQELTGWSGDYVIADGSILYATEGGSIRTADLTTGGISTLVTLPTTSTGPLLVLDEARGVAPITTTTTGPAPAATTPPLVAADPGDGVDETTLTRWVAGGAVVTIVALLAWLAVRRPSSPHDSS